MKTVTSTFALVALSSAATAALGNDDPWALLDGITVTEIFTPESYVVEKIFPADIERGMRDFRITGYAMPITPGAQVRDLVLVADMGNCPFCGSPDHGATLQVELDEPVVIEEGQRISVIGNLEAITDPETWQATILRGARLSDL